MKNVKRYIKKKQRYNVNCTCSNNHSALDTCGNKHSDVNRTKWNIKQSSRSKRKNRRNTKRRTNKIVKDYVVFDTETTGLDPSCDKIIEISAIKFIDNKKVETFSTLINPKEVINPFITQLTGIKQEDLKDKPTINEVIPQFFDFIEDLTLVAHNAPYDIKMLASECYRNKKELCNNKIIDTVTLAKRIIPRESIENYKLATLKEYLGLNYDSHRALDDCETCSKVYQLYLNSTQKKKIVIMDENTGEIIEELN